MLFIWIDVIETVNLVYSYLKTIGSYRTDPFCIAFALWVWACLCTSFSMMCCSINDSLVQVGRSIANPRAFLHSLIPHGAVSPTVQYFISYSCSSSIVSRLNSLMNKKKKWKKAAKRSVGEKCVKKVQSRGRFLFMRDFLTEWVVSECKLWIPTKQQLKLNYCLQK